MRQMTLPRLASLAAVCLAFSGSAFAQLGPIEPSIIPSKSTSRVLSEMPDMSDDYVIPVEVTVGADGTVQDVLVTTSSGSTAADDAAKAFMREKHFLPALDEKGQPVEGKAVGNVEVHSKTANKQLKANMKLLNTQAEVARVRKLTCKDFTWEVERLRNEGNSPDVSHEIMPWVSLRIYILDKKVAKEMESPLLDKWSAAFAEAEKQCKDAPSKNYLTDVLTPLLAK